MIDSKYTYGGSRPCHLTVPGQTNEIAMRVFKKGAFQESSEPCWSWSSARTKFRAVPRNREEFHETSVAYKIRRWSSRNVLQHWFLLNSAYQYWDC